MNGPRIIRSLEAAIATAKAAKGPPEGCSCHPETRPPVCQHEHATLHCHLTWARSRIAELEARLQERDAFLVKVGAWMDFVDSLPPPTKE